MAEDKKATKRGVVVEFDFTAVDGAQILFDTARRVLASRDVELTVKLEAKHLLGGNCQGALAELFGALDVLQDAGAVARELCEEFAKALAEAAPAAVNADFKAFVKTLVERGVKVVVATRADVEAIRPLFADFDPDLVTLYSEPSTTYGNCKWDAWRRAYAQNGLVDVLSAAVTGSGKGVKSALVAGLSAAGVVHPHTAWQDFGGADVVSEKVNAALAKEVLRMLHL